MRRTVSWFSCGVASAVATKLMLAETELEIAYCETGSEHIDNWGFLTECEAWFGQKIEHLRSDTYTDTWDVFERRKYLAGISGAPCTVELKLMPRLAWQRPDDIHVFGYTADAKDVVRADRLRDNYPEMTIRTPLIEKSLTKAACLALVQGAGIELPSMYAMGFHTNNCIPCVKATSASYWALVRQNFPMEFGRMVELSRRLGVRLTRINSKRAFIDEIPLDYPTTDPVQPACDFLCHAVENDLET
jgi:hypothetical protein